ncbi:MAG: hypothetical protein WD401_03775 [Thermomicrobiaceae bacterium]
MLKIAVVGGCASGKTTIVRELRSRGLNAYVVGQEHSGVAGLWKHQEPDVLVFLYVELESVRARRDHNWPEWLYRTQQQRLQCAYEAASIRVNTSKLSVEQALTSILAGLPVGEDYEESPSSESPP